MKEQQYYVVWERSRKRARAYTRKLPAIFDHVRFKRKQGVWFLDGIGEEAMKERLADVKLKMVV